jgi:pimeloyl-ACP methyl ester carboxylesterase
MRSPQGDVSGRDAQRGNHAYHAAMLARPALALVTTLATLAACRPEPTSSPADTVPVTEAPPVASEARTPAGPEIVHLQGAIEVPGGSKLEYFAVLERGPDGTYSGKLDIPMQGARDVPLEDVQVDDARIAFTLAPVKATWSAKVSGEALECSFSQMGVSLPCEMERTTAEAMAAAKKPPARPQTPQPPFPYEAVEVEYDNAAAGVHLAGTLTLPKSAGPHPVALLISGSGAQDRDETIMGHKPFAVIADRLTRDGVAVLRVDDRGVGGTSRGDVEPTSEDFVGDVLAGVEFLAKDPRIDRKRIGLIGHSEGGAIAPLAASRSKKIAFVVLLAGPGVTGRDLLVEQVGALAEASGMPPEKVSEAKAKQARVLDVVADPSNDLEAAKAKIREILAPDGSGSSPEIDAQVAMALSPWFRFFVTYDPAPALRKTRCPVLVLNGELDRQVVASQNVPAIEKALKKGGNRKVTVHRLAGLNHLFQPAKTGGVEEYDQIEQTIAPEALDVLATWVATQAGVSKP